MVITLKMSQKYFIFINKNITFSRLLYHTSCKKHIAKIYKYIPRIFSLFYIQITILYLNAYKSHTYMYTHTMQATQYQKIVIISSCFI